jgi:hypothetical protein
VKRKPLLPPEEEEKFYWEMEVVFEAVLRQRLAANPALAEWVRGIEAGAADRRTTFASSGWESDGKWSRKK